MGHEERFLQRLVEFRQYSIAPNEPRKWLVYAAVVVILLLSVPAALYFVQPNQQPQIDTEAYLSDEQKEAQFYYVSSIQSGVSTLEKMLLDTELPKEQKEIIDDVVSNFEKRREDILLDLNASDGDQRVVDALLDYYRIKLEVINGIVQKLESLNKDEHETEQKIEL